MSRIRLPYQQPTPDTTDILPAAHRPFKRFLKFVTPHWRLMVVTVTAATIRTGLLLVMPLVVKYITDDLILNEDLSAEAKLDILGKMALPVAAVLLLVVGAHYCRTLLSGILSMRVIMDLRTALFRHVQRLGLRFFEERKTGVILSRLLEDVNLAQSFVTTALSTIAIDSVALLVAIGIMLNLDWRMTLLSLAVLPIIGFQLRFFRNRVRQSSRITQEQHAKYTGNLYERIAGYPLILSHAAERREDRRAFGMFREYFKARLDLLKKGAAFTSCLALLSQCAPVAIFWYAAWRIIGDPGRGVPPEQQLTMGTMIAFMALLGWMLGPLGRFAELNLTINNALAGVERVFQVFDIQPDVPDPASDIPPAAPLAQPVRGEIELVGVEFEYKKGLPVIAGVDLTVPAGGKLAVVGTSGHGKTTLVKLIARFYDVDAGAVKIDGRDLREIPLGDLRAAIGIVSQDVIVFSGSIRENIAYGATGNIRRVSEEAIVEAARAAHTWEFIERFPDGLDTEIGERGVKLSAGQRQRVALARLFLRNPAILLLDEATSALDSVSERLVQDALDHLMEGRTSVIVAHRLSTVRHVDQIAVVEKGEIVELGKHDELLAANGVYAKLHAQQYFIEASENGNAEDF